MGRDDALAMDIGKGDASMCVCSLETVLGTSTRCDIYRVTSLGGCPGNMERRSADCILGIVPSFPI